MRTEPLSIDGVAGPIVVETNLISGKHQVTVGGNPVPGGRRGKFDLPAVGGGTVSARVRSNLLEPYPIITVAGTKHLTGPPSPLILKILGLLPLLSLGIAIGAIPAVIAVLSVFVNLAVARTTQSMAIKALLMVGVSIAAAAAVFAIASAASSIG